MATRRFEVTADTLRCAECNGELMYSHRTECPHSMESATTRGYIEVEVDEAAPAREAAYEWKFALGIEEMEQMLNSGWALDSPIYWDASEYGVASLGLLRRPAPAAAPEATEPMEGPHSD